MGMLDPETINIANRIHFLEERLYKKIYKKKEVVGSWHNKDL
jgi:hypothetical protein